VLDDLAVRLATAWVLGLIIGWRNFRKIGSSLCVDFHRPLDALKFYPVVAAGGES